MNPLFEKYNLKHLSISQVKTIKRSPFAWVCEKILKRRGPPTEATTFGSFVHENFEVWLEKRIEEPTEVIISEECKPFWMEAWNDKVFKFWGRYRILYPKWPSKEGIEAGFSIKLHEELPPFIGKVDVLEVTDGELTIQDHKTIGNKSFAHKTPEDVGSDPQLNLYAHAFSNMGTSTHVNVQHNQLFKKIKTEKNCVNILSARLDWENVNKTVEGVTKDALAVIKILEDYEALGIEGFADKVKTQYAETRWDFGGCPHWDFHQECLQKFSESQIKKVYTKNTVEGNDDMPVDLHNLVGKARDHFSAQGLTKFELADAIVEAVVKNLVKTGTKAIFIHGGEAGDLIYNQLLNQVAEKNITIFKKIS